MSIRTRLAESKDAAELARLNEEFNQVHEEPAALALRIAKMGQTEIAILAEIDGNIVGFAGLRVVPCLFYNQPYAELTELYIRPQYRMMGVGRALVEHAECLAKEKDAGEIMLLTGFNNREAQAFYRRLGYRVAELAMEKGLWI